MIKALIVEDSGFMRMRIRDVLSNDREIKVVGTANNGHLGFDSVLKLKPDVVITDLVMPEYDGLYLVKKVMKENPVPIVLLSSLNKTNQQVFDALEQGAFAFIDKPLSPGGLGFNQPFIDLVKAAARVQPSALMNKHRRHNNLEHIFSDTLYYDIVLIGTSTGGPSAIECILEGLPSSFPVPIVIAQHMPARFLESFSTRLSSYTKLKVKLAKKGAALEPNHVYICPGDTNTCITRKVDSGQAIFSHTSRKYEEFNEPSVDCLFETAADVYKGRIVSIILTGMGKDGTRGLRRIRKYGGMSIAQNEASAVVYGMPKSAVDEGLVDYTLDIKEIAAFITGCFS